ncbi:unnamed protein product [Pleuronectes platessa]|uniref:Uncharacterized protein n=1 Tax=Pleuronectes platessa TaxID=8262 RepID=A0A9N7YPA0_PLEPL|nr:unnamed protein product [Pleuronectes platessa]
MHGYSPKTNPEGRIPNCQSEGLGACTHCDRWMSPDKAAPEEGDVHQRRNDTVCTGRDREGDHRESVEWIVRIRETSGRCCVYFSGLCRVSVPQSGKGGPYLKLALKTPPGRKAERAEARADCLLPV